MEGFGTVVGPDEWPPGAGAGVRPPRPTAAAPNVPLPHGFPAMPRSCPTCKGSITNAKAQKCSHCGAWLSGEGTLFGGDVDSEEWLGSNSGAGSGGGAAGAGGSRFAPPPPPASNNRPPASASAPPSPRTPPGGYAAPTRTPQPTPPATRNRKPDIDFEGSIVGLGSLIDDIDSHDGPIAAPKPHPQSRPALDDISAHDAAPVRKAPTDGWFQKLVETKKNQGHAPANDVGPIKPVAKLPEPSSPPAPPPPAPPPPSTPKSRLGVESEASPKRPIVDEPTPLPEGRSNKRGPNKPPSSPHVGIAPTRKPENFPGVPPAPPVPPIGRPPDPDSDVARANPTSPPRFDIADEGATQTNVQLIGVRTDRIGLTRDAYDIQILDAEKSWITLKHVEGKGKFKLSRSEQLADEDGWNTMSSRHAEFEITTDGLVVVENKSLNGVFVKIRDLVQLADGDEIRFGNYRARYREGQLSGFSPAAPVLAEDGEEFVAVDIGPIAHLEFLRPDPALPPVRFPVVKPETRIGRGGTDRAGNEIHVDVPLRNDPTVSRVHARLVHEKRARAILLEDQSSFGTFLRVRDGKALLHHDDILALGQVYFRIVKVK